MRDGPKQRPGGELVCFWINVLCMIGFFFVLGDLILLLKTTVLTIHTLNFCI